MSRISWVVAIGGIICEAIGIHMLYIGTTATFGTVSFSAAPLPLIIGVILIIVALVKFPKSCTTGQNPTRAWFARNWLILLGILIGVVLLVVFFSLHYDPAKDKGKYDILVNLILIVIGITAAVGYGIFKWISRSVQEKVMKEVTEDRNIARAQTQLTLGYVWYQNNGAEEERQKDLGQIRKKLRKIQAHIGHEGEAEADDRNQRIT